MIPPSEYEGVAVVHSVGGDIKATSYLQMWKMLKLLRDTEPFPGAVRYPHCLYVPNKILFSVLNFFYHVVFGLFVDIGLRLAGRKPM